MTADLHLLRQLYRPASMADLGESLAAKFRELGARPCADACNYLLRDLTEAKNAVARLRDDLERGEPPTS